MNPRRARYCLLLAVPSALIMSMALAGAQGALPDEAWNKTFGGPHGDGAWSLQGTRDGGYIIAGYTSSRGQGSDLWLVKVDSEGNKQWEKTFGGAGEDVGYSVVETRDGGYVAAGITRSYGMGNEYLWLLKTDSKGGKLWDRTFGGFVSSSGDGAWSVYESDDGGYIVTGYTRSFGAGGKDLWLIKTDYQGKIQWDETFGGSKDDVGMSVIQTREGGFLAAGRTASYGAGRYDIWLIKTDRAGKEQWNRTFGGSGDDVGFQVVEVADGYVVVGRTESVGLGGKKAFLLKADLKGEKLWQMVYQEGSDGLSVQRIAAGGYILAGHIEAKDGSRDAWLARTTAAGLEEWSMRLGGLGQDMASAVVESSDNGYVIAGITNSFGAGAEDIWLVKLAPQSITSVSGQAK